MFHRVNKLKKLGIEISLGISVGLMIRQQILRHISPRMKALSQLVFIHLCSGRCLVEVAAYWRAISPVTRFLVFRFQGLGICIKEHT